jgi:hypothetical protein
MIEVTPDDLKVILASTRRIVEVSADIKPEEARRDIQMEAAAILALLSSKVP